MDGANFVMVTLLHFTFLLLRALRYHSETTLLFINIKNTRYGQRPPSILREFSRLPVFGHPAKVHVKRPCSRSQASERDKLGEDAETVQLDGDFVDTGLVSGEHEYKYKQLFQGPGQGDNEAGETHGVSPRPAS